MFWPGVWDLAATVSTHHVLCALHITRALIVSFRDLFPYDDRSSNNFRPLAAFVGPCRHHESTIRAIALG